MDLAKLLNSEDNRQPKASLSRSLDQRLPPLPSSTSGTNSSSYFPRYSSLHSLTPLQSALPPLSRSNSDDSDISRSPITPTYTPDRTPNLSFERDHKRHYSGSVLDQHPVPGDSLKRPMDTDLSLTSDFIEGLPFPTYLQHRLHPTQQNPLPQQPLPDLIPNLPNLPVTPFEQPILPAAAQRPPQQKTGKKNSYPCPVAKQYTCPEHFTTSGHAARHAKKHTGKKDAICPECSKGFTRKDNMEQHRRTHNGGRSSTGKPSTSADESRQRKVVKIQQSQQKRSTAQPPMALEDATLLANLEMPQQAMPATVPDANTLFARDLGQSMMLDQQLDFTGQTSFPDDISMAMPLAGDMPMAFNMDIGAAAPVSNMSSGRPSHTLQRSVPATNVRGLRSPSATSSEGPSSPRSPLDQLADAAAQMGESSQMMS